MAISTISMAVSNNINIYGPELSSQLEVVSVTHFLVEEL